jgi:transcriptional regulator with XRE-family HTH domain
MIMRRVVARRKELGLSQNEVGRRVANSDLYGKYSEGTYRNLENENFELTDNPRTTLNKQLVTALSEALECTVSDLATEYDLEGIRAVPYRRAQWTDDMLDELAQEKPRTTVAAPRMAAKRIRAYAMQHAYNTATEFAKAMRGYGYQISDRNMQRIWEHDPDAKVLQRVVTFEFCEAVAKVFRGRLQKDHFDTQWILKCHDRCPHCYPIMIYG